MPQFTFHGTLELSGVCFFVNADNEADAKQKAKAGKFEFYEADGADMRNWKLDPATMEENEV